MAQAEGSIGAGSIDLIGTDHFGVVTMTAAIGLAKADNAVRNASAVRLIKNGLLTDQLADNQQLLVGISPSRQKACTTSS